jgi:hypothetical protein
MNESHFNVKNWKSTTYIFLALLLCLCAAVPPMEDNLQGIGFTFREQPYRLEFPIRLGPRLLFQRGGLSNASLDTSSHCYYTARHYVEIVRQDHATEPTIGLALGFEFDPENGDFPYTPAHAVAQIKDFRWGGVEFGSNDTLNFTGVSNDVSDDIQITIEGFANDTIWGEFSGLLLNGAEQMATLDRGWFRVKVYRK